MRCFLDVLCRFISRFYWQEGSQVYEFNTVMNRVTLIQQLPHTDVKKVIHYRDPHDDKHYVLVLNSDATPTIYWWSSDQMQEWQQLVNSEAVGSPNSAGILVLHNLESIILISNGGTITLYTDDMTGHYSATFTLHTTCITVEDLHGVRLGPDYYIFYVCTGTVNRLEARLLHLETVVLGKEETEGDPLLRCLEQLTTMLGDRKKDIAYLESVVTSDALMTVDHPQVHIQFLL
ncbi:uncharacterized protein LOC121872391 [Homarus americanus]|uniref:uncharacterized protein LOC121872391 n=1 Tax=Homarus americanus TaxID=6706 RepID=UPI001C44123D|nr:uncharacterized protein LOC121872391 [Homarus americanus]